MLCVQGKDVVCSQFLVIIEIWFACLVTLFQFSLCGIDALVHLSLKK